MWLIIPVSQFLGAKEFLFRSIFIYLHIAWRHGSLMRYQDLICKRAWGSIKNKDWTQLLLHTEAAQKAQHILYPLFISKRNKFWWQEICFHPFSDVDSHCIDRKKKTWKEKKIARNKIFWDPFLFTMAAFLLFWLVSFGRPLISIISSRSASRAMTAVTGSNAESPYIILPLKPPENNPKHSSFMA